MIDPTKTSNQLAMAEIWAGLPSWLSGKESTCRAGDADVGAIPGLGRSPRGESGTPHSSILAGKSHGQKACWAAVQRVTKTWTQLSD